MSEATTALTTARNASDTAISPHTQARDVLTVADPPDSKPARVVVEAECGILVYPPEEAGEPWRAVFTENGRRRFRQAMTEAELAAKLAKVTERLRAGAPDMERPGADLIAHYLDPDRLPVAKRWSRRHADTQRRLCQRFAAPVIAGVTCQDITAGHMQQIVSAAPTASEGERLHRCLSAMVTAGIKGGYLANPRAAGGALAGRRAARARAGGQHVRGIGAVGRPGRDPGRRGYRQARPGAGRRAARATCVQCLPGRGPARWTREISLDARPHATLATDY